MHSQIQTCPYCKLLDKFTVGAYPAHSKGGRADSSGAHNPLYSIALTLAHFASTDSPVTEAPAVECYLCPTMAAQLLQRLKWLGNSKGLCSTQTCLCNIF